MHCQASLTETIRYLISVFGRSDLSDRLGVSERRLKGIEKGHIMQAVFTDIGLIADRCGFLYDNVLEEKIDPICAEKFLRGEKEIIPKRFTENAFSQSVTSLSILENTPRFMREKAMRYLQLTHAGLKKQKFVSMKLNIELLGYLKKLEAIPYVVGQNTYFTYLAHDFSSAFRGLSIKDSYDKLINEVVKHVTESSIFELIKLNDQEAIFTSRYNPDMELEYDQDLTDYELGFGSIIPVLAQGQIIEGVQTKSPSSGHGYSQYHFDFETAHPFFQYQ